MIAMMIAEILEKAGCVVIGPESRLDSAMKIAGGRELDGGLLDVNLGGEMVFPLAEQLDLKRVPYVFVSGYALAMLPERFQDRPFLAKPFMEHVLLRTLEHATRGGDHVRPTAG